MQRNGGIGMMRETGRRLLGIGARARFAAYSLFEKKSSGDSNFAPEAGKYILKSPDGALEVTVSGGRLTYSASVGDRSAHSGRQKYRRKCHPRRAEN